MSLLSDRTKASVLAAGLAFCAAVAPRAHAELITGGALNYGVLVEPGAHSVQTSNGAIVGNIGIGDVTVSTPTPANLQNTSGTITGNVDFANAIGTVQNPIIGSVNHSVAAVTSAINTINALASTISGEAGSSLTINIGNNGDLVVNASTGILDPGGNRVFTVDSSGFNLNSNSDLHGLTISGSASDFVVINFAKMQNINGAIFLTGGLTPDNVVFNYTGGGNFNPSSNHHTISGDFLAVGAKVTWNAVTINGRLFGGADGQDFQMNSGFNLNAPAVLPTPEPATIALALSGLATLGIARAWRGRRRKRA